MGDEKVTQEVNQMSVTERKIARQIEFYFGDVNLPKDKFLQEKIKEDDGWVTLECLTTFNRLKQLSTDLEEIKTALKKSKNKILEICEDDYKIRRSKDHPVPDWDDPMVRKEKQMKTLYMKGFPLSYSFDEIQDFLAENDASSVYIKLRRDAKGDFKGSIFVELANLDEAEKLLNNEELKCGDTVLKILRREDYFKEKGEERGHNKSQKPNRQKNENRGDKAKDIASEWKPGMVFHFKNADGLRREDIKRYFNEYEPVSWIDFNQGENQGFLRFKQEGGAQRALDAAKAAGGEEQKIVIKEKELETRVIEGEEEENFWKMAAIDDQKRLNSSSQRRNQKGGRNQRNKDGGRHRKRPWQNKEKEEQNKDLDTTPQNEHKKFDSDDEGVASEQTKTTKETETQKESSIETSEPVEAKKQKLDVEE